MFELAGFVRQPEQIRVGGIRGVLARLDRQLVRVAVVDHLGAAGEPLEERAVAPRGVDGDFRREHVRAELEAHLVVPAAGRAVREHLDAALPHLGHHPRDDHVPADAGRVPVRPFVAGLELDHLDAAFGDHVVQRNRDVVRGAARPHPRFDLAEVRLVRLGDIGGEAHDLDAVLGEPFRDGAGIETARGGERDGLALQVGNGGHGVSSAGMELRVRRYRVCEQSRPLRAEAHHASLHPPDDSRPPFRRNDRACLRDAPERVLRAPRGAHREWHRPCDARDLRSGTTLASPTSYLSNRPRPVRGLPGDAGERHGTTRDLPFAPDIGPIPSRRDVAENTYGETVVHLIVGLSRAIRRGAGMVARAKRSYREADLKRKALIGRGYVYNGPPLGTLPSSLGSGHARPCSCGCLRSCSPSGSPFARQSQPAKPAGIKFQVKLDPMQVGAKPQSGRVLVGIAKARQRPDFTNYRPPVLPILGADADAFAADTVVTLDNDSLTFPIGKLNDLPAGEYSVQAIFATNRDINLPNAPAIATASPVP